MNRNRATIGTIDQARRAAADHGHRINVRPQPSETYVKTYICARCQHGVRVDTFDGGESVYYVSDMLGRPCEPQPRR
jgi:hypothetical protein